MNRDQINQLAQLALVTRDPELLARAVQELMHVKQAEPLPLFSNQQPAVHEVGVSAQSLAAALDNLPPLVAKQPPVELVELETTVPKADPWMNPTPYMWAHEACRLWNMAYGDRWMSNTAAFGANSTSLAGNLRWVIQELVRPTPEMSQRAIGKILWQRIERLKPKGWLIQERVRLCDGYTVTEHSIVPEGENA
jgi:hypothetical protein